jgi:hypothetical protein
MQDKNQNKAQDEAAAVQRTQKTQKPNPKSPYKTREGQLPPIQAKQKPVQRKPDDLKTKMGNQYGVDLSGYKEHTSSSFPGSVGAVAAIQGKDIHYAPGQFTEKNRKHELGHAIDNTINGTPKGDKVVNGQNVDTTREKAADKIADTPLQMKSMDSVEVKQPQTSSQAPIQRKVVNKDGYALTIASDDFETEALQVWGYIKSKGFQEQFAGKTINLIKTAGKSDKICHHWSFGGLNADFSKNIQQIADALGASTMKMHPEWGIEIPDIDWGAMSTPNGLNDLGDTSDANIRIFDKIDHSARKKDGEWYHKFNGFDCIFAISGGDDNLIYSSTTDIGIKALNESGLGAKSTFTYAKIDSN